MTSAATGTTAGVELDAEAATKFMSETDPDAARAQPPKYVVTGRCTFKSGDGSVEMGHKHDFSARTFSMFNESSSSQTIEVAMLYWVAGPLRDKIDVKIGGAPRSGLESGWEVNVRSTANDDVTTVDIVAMQQVEISAPMTTIQDTRLQQQMMLLLDARTNPMQAYLSRTPQFSGEDSSTAIDRVGFAVQRGTCTLVGR